jgi:hypothetical protein
MTFARTAGAEKQCILAPGDESPGGQVEYQTAVDLGIESEIEIVEGLLRVAKSGLFSASFEKSLAATSELVGDQAGDQIDGCHWFGLGLAQTSLQHGGHTAEP